MLGKMQREGGEREDGDGNTPDFGSGESWLEPRRGNGKAVMNDLADNVVAAAAQDAQSISPPPAARSAGCP